MVQQLLQQNAILQQELLDARLSSGSGSNVSHEARLEGRGLGRATVGSGSGVHRKGKGVGAENFSEGIGTQSGRVFVPPWTTLATHSEAQVGFIQPNLNMPPPIPSNLARSDSPGFGDVSARSLEASGLSTSALPPQSHVSRGVGGTTYRSPTSLLPSEDEGRLPLSVKHWNAGDEATGQIVGRGVFPGIQQSSQDRGWPSSSEVHQVETVGEQLQTLALQPAPVAKPPPSISDLDQPRRPPALPAPPLPRAAASSGSRRTIQLMVDGLQREGYLDDQGFIQVGGPKHFNIGSDGEDEATPKARASAPVSSPNPFAPGAQSPFRESPDRVEEKQTNVRALTEIPPPPPPSETWSRGSRRRSPSPRTPNPRRNQWPTSMTSPLTPGGTKVPAGPPPPSPPPLSTSFPWALSPLASTGPSEQATPCRPSPASEASCDRSSERDFVPGERTMWELPKLAPVSEANPAMRCNDWLHRIQPSIYDLAPKAFIWWKYVLSEAKAAYDKWCAAGPLERSLIKGQPSEYLKGEVFVRLESRTLAMLSKALPATIFELALSGRNTTCVGLIYLTLKTYQPGGLSERSELLRGLTVLPVAQTAAAGVSTIQTFFRHLDRARSMGVSIPDCSLLIEGLDRMSTPLVEKYPNLMFRMHSIRMHLQLDTVPSMSAVDQWARSLLAELEVLAVSGVEGSTNKRTRVAAVAGKASKDNTSAAPPKAEARKVDSNQKEACRHWATEQGCRKGRNCAFAHTLEKPGKCWVCGGNHQKADCTMPGGGKGPAPEAKGKAKPSIPSTKDNGSKGSGKSSTPKAPGADASAALKEATQLLQSLKLARLSPDSGSLDRLKRLTEAEGAKGLIDGGATACLRTASSKELHLPTISVQLAAGECKLHVNASGTLLSRQNVAPIVSVAALLRLGYSITWSNQDCCISHPVHGKLDVDTSTGCPEVAASTALQLIADYEALVGRNQVREGRIKRIMGDLEIASDEELVTLLRSEGSEAEAALRVLVHRRFPQVPSEMVEQLTVPVQDVQGPQTWNRKARRRHAKSNGLLVHLFCGNSRRAFEGISERNRLSHVTVDVKENLLRQTTYQYLMMEAIRGRIRILIGGPPCRTNSVCRYFPLTEQNIGPRPVRIRGDSLCHMDHDYLTGTEVAMRQIDDLLYMRFLVLYCIATECNRASSAPDPGFIVEQPEDPEAWALRESEWRGKSSTDVHKMRPEKGFATFWSAPEWISLVDQYGLHEVSFDQGPLLHTKRKPTTIGTNMVPAAELMGCRGPGMEGCETRGKSITQSKAWAEWAPGLVAALGYMISDWIKQEDRSAHHKLKKVDPSFIEHIRQQHIPYRRDCKFCVQGGGRQRQHRRILSPQAWTLSVDTAGPFSLAQDESTTKAKYFVIGVLTIPRVVAKAIDPIVAKPEPEKDESKDPEGEDDIAELLEAADWLADEEESKDKDKPATAKDDEHIRESWKRWMELVEGSQTEWKKEAESHYLPKVEMIDWVYLEPIPSKNTADVLHAVGKMYAAARSDGFDVRRLHSDRGKEFFNNPMKVWCTRHGIHKTYALPEEHQSNGRAEGAIMRVKAKIRTILHSSGCSKEEWPLAGRLAAHALRNSARQRLSMPTLPSVPYNSKVQVLQRSWTRGVWESLTLTAHTKAPSGDSSRGWIVKTTDGRLLTTGVLFPAPLSEQDVEVTYKSDPVPVSEPERRIRGKTTLKAMQALPCEAASGCSFDDLECLAREHLERQAFELEPALQVLSKAKQCMPSASQQVWKQKIGGSEHDGTVGLTTPTRSHPWFSRYVSLLFAHHTSCPVACVEIQWGGELAMRPRKSYQPGTRCAVLSLSAKCQIRTRDVTSPAANQHCPLLQARCAEAGQWKSVHGGLDQDVFLVGYTPKRTPQVVSGKSLPPPGHRSYVFAMHTAGALVVELRPWPTLQASCHTSSWRVSLTQLCQPSLAQRLARAHLSRRPSFCRWVKPTWPRVVYASS